MPEQTELTEVAHRESAALAELTDLLSGVAVCRVPADRALRAKRLEGRAAALADLRRALTVPGAPLATALGEVGARWATGPGGPLWEAYRAGGRQALGELAGGVAEA
jgi:hypothetical protein